MEDIFARMTARVAQVGPVSAASSPVDVGPSRAQSDDGTVRVEVTDSLVTSLEIDGVDPQLAQRVVGLVNDALRANQSRVLEAAKRINPSYARLMQVLEETNADIQEAVRQSMGGS